MEQWRRKVEGVERLTYNGCPMIQGSWLNFNGRIDTGEKTLTLCCEPVPSKPASALKSTAQETIESFLNMRNGVVLEGKKFANNTARGKRIYTEGCSQCVNYQPGEWDGDGLIHYVNLSMYPAPCQCKCFYCGVHRGESGIFNRDSCGEYYEALFDALDYAKEKRIIAPNAVWQVSSGEITIHPYKDRILSLTKKQRTAFYTNCFLYDEEIAENLSSNPYSAINLSIDSGTPETWFKVKGVDNFDAVTDNLVKYMKSSARAGQISLKYIVLPGINDNWEDYVSLIEIMKILRVKHLTISRDTRKKYHSNSEELENLIGASGYLLAMLIKNEISADMFSFSPSEQERTAMFAKELLQAEAV